MLNEVIDDRETQGRVLKQTTPPASDFVGGVGREGKVQDMTASWEDYERRRVTKEKTGHPVGWCKTVVPHRHVFWTPSSVSAGVFPSHWVTEVWGWT